MEPRSKPFLKQLNNEQRAELRKLYNYESDERLQEAIAILHNWVQKQNHFLKKDFSEDYLITSLGTCKGYIERAKKQLDKLCTLKTLLPKYFEFNNIKEEFGDVLHAGTPLPMFTEDYYRVILIKVQKKHLLRETIIKFYRLGVIMAEYFKKNDFVNGFVFVDDLRDINILDLITCLNTTDLQQILTVLIDGYGTRIKGVHLLTESKTVDLLVKAVKPFLSEKIANRIRVHPSLEDLHKAIPKNLLPVEYGGTERSHQQLCEEWVEEISSPEHQEYMKMMSKAKTDESRRLLCDFNEEYLGMPGSFRNLIVD